MELLLLYDFYIERKSEKCSRDSHHHQYTILLDNQNLKKSKNIANPNSNMHFVIVYRIDDSLTTSPRTGIINLIRWQKIFLQGV